MLIQGILSRLSHAAGLGHARDHLQATVGKAAGTAGISSLSGSAPTGQLNAVLSQYDVTDISPQSFSDMLQQLHQSKLLPDKDYQELSTIRQDLDSQGIAPAQRINLLDLYTKKLKSLDDDSKQLTSQLGTAGFQSAKSAIARRLDWLEKLSAIHASPSTATINALA